MQNSRWYCQCYCQWKHKGKKALIDHSQLQSSQILVCDSNKNHMHSLLSKPGFDITVLSDIGAEVCVGTVQLKESWKFGRDLYLWWCRYSLPHILPWFWAVFWTRLCCRSCAIKASLNFKPELLDFNRGPFAFSALGPLLTLNMENSWFLIGGIS